MGNEASLEGGEGGISGLPEGIAPDGKGGYIQVPAGMEADLSKLSEEERKQIAAVMSRAQSKPLANPKDAPSPRHGSLGCFSCSLHPPSRSLYPLRVVISNVVISVLQNGSSARRGAWAHTLIPFYTFCDAD